MASEPPTHVNGVAVPYGVPIVRLRELALGGSRDKWAAFVALAHSPDAESLQALDAACDSGDWPTRRAGVEAIGQHTSGRSSARIVLRLLGDANDVVRRAACAAAAGLGLVEARSALHQLRG